MPTTTLPPNRHLAAPFVLLARRKDYDVYVESERATDAYVVDDDGRAEFKRGESFYSYGKSRNRRQHSFSVTVPARRRCYLLLVNWSHDNVAVHYEVEG